MLLFSSKHLKVVNISALRQKIISYHTIAQHCNLLVNETKKENNLTFIHLGTNLTNPIYHAQINLLAFTCRQFWRLISELFGKVLNNSCTYNKIATCFSSHDIEHN